jgi:hypothetical protein
MLDAVGRTQGHVGVGMISPTDQHRHVGSVEHKYGRLDDAGHLVVPVTIREFEGCEEIPALLVTLDVRLIAKHLFSAHEAIEPALDYPPSLKITGFEIKPENIRTGCQMTG